MESMEGFPDNNFPSAASGGTPTAPPPPPEVKVRTMRSDLESMAKSGGGLPRFETVQVENMGMTVEAPLAPVAASRGRGIRALVIIVIVLAVLGGAGYFVYRAYQGGGLPFFGATGMGAGSGAAPASSTTPIAVANTPAAPSPATSSASNSAPVSASGATSGAAVPAGPFTHVSLFKKPADQTLAFTLAPQGAASSAADLSTLSQKISALLAGANRSASMVEISVRNPDATGVAISDLLAAENASVIDPGILAAHFSPDATFFAYRAAGGFAPGYVLSLDQGENWAALEGPVSALESSPNTANLFLSGGASSGAFMDAVLGGNAVRTRADGLTYGWYQTYLVISTSKNGFTAAVARLQ